MQLLDRALNALTLVSQSADGLTVSELAKKLDMPVSTTYRILSSLKRCNYVFQSKKSKKYYISYKLFTLCDYQKKNNSLLSIARPEMKVLANKLNKPVVICVLNGDKILNLDCIENRNASIYLIRTGIEVPLYTTSAGRVFAAYMSEEEIDEGLKQHKITKQTPYTKIDSEQIKTELKKIRSNGYAILDEELQINVQGAACPIFSGTGEVVAAVAFTTIKTEKPISKDELKELLECASRISEFIK